MKKRLVALMMMAVLAVGTVTGCGSDGTGGSTDTEKTDAVNQEETGTDSEAPADAAKDEAEPDSGEETEITVWAWDASFNGYALEEAQKVYDGNVKVNFVEMAKADCLQKIHTTLASGVTDDLPDVVLISDLNAPGYLMSYPGAFRPMEDLLNYDDFAGYKKSMLSYDGTAYGIPFDTGGAGLFYRTDYV